MLSCDYVFMAVCLQSNQPSAKSLPRTIQYDKLFYGFSCALFCLVFMFIAFQLYPILLKTLNPVVCKDSFFLPTEFFSICLNQSFCTISSAQTDYWNKPRFSNKFFFYSEAFIGRGIYKIRTSSVFWRNFLILMIFSKQNTNIKTRLFTYYLSITLM